MSSHVSRQRFSLVWEGTMGRYDMVWYHMISYHIIWYDMISYDIMSYDTAWYDMAWYDMVWYDVILGFTIRHDTISYDMIRYIIISCDNMILWYTMLMIWYDVLCWLMIPVWSRWHWNRQQHFEVAQAPTPLHRIFPASTMRGGAYWYYGGP